VGEDNEEQKEKESKEEEMRYAGTNGERNSGSRSVILHVMYLKRAAEQVLQEILASHKVGVILGARQVGKTTLAEHVLARQPAVFLNFDSPATFYSITCCRESSTL
jgi:hypothetical protein